MRYYWKAENLLIKLVIVKIKYVRILHNIITLSYRIDCTCIVTKQKHIVGTH